MGMGMGGTVHAIVVQRQQEPDAIQLVLSQAASLQTGRLCNLRPAARSNPAAAMCSSCRVIVHSSKAVCHSCSADLHPVFKEG